MKGEHFKVGSYLKVIREKQGISQYAIAAHLKVSQPFIIRIEENETYLPVKKISDYCEFLNINKEMENFIRFIIVSERFNKTFIENKENENG